MNRLDNQWKNQHLAWRAGFGPQARDIEILRNNSPSVQLKAMIAASQQPPTYIDVVSNSMEGMLMNRRNLSVEEKRQLRKQSRDDIKTLNLRWLDEMIASPAQLREKMAFFWHGHFACRNLNIYYQQLLLHIVRTNALGNFGDLLKQVSKSAAMLNFLNNNQNRKGHPNENFAREVMELFTMGRGNYSETDIKEAARAFTGWGADASGAFVFRNNQHDDGSKRFLGQEGNFNGDDILAIILAQPATANFITGKLIRYFVNEQAPREKIDYYADRFRQSGYDIQSLLADLFSSNWFYDVANTGNRIKSPIELWVGIRRQLPFDLPAPEIQLLVEKLLGQVLFYPPNVAGWPAGKNWIDSSTLLFRMRLPQLITGNEALQLNPKQDDDIQMGRAPVQLGRNFRAIINWPAYIQAFADSKETDRYETVNRFLLQSKHQPSAAVFENHNDKSSPELAIGTLTLNLMSTPEYQIN